MSLTRYALSRTTNDRWSITFRPDCDRTMFDPITGKDESLIELIQRLDNSGYDLYSYNELIEELLKRGVNIF